MAKVSYKDAKTGKPMSKKTVESFVKKHTKPKIKKEGIVYKVVNNKYKEGV
tara:strand:- start:442 stop:594 length:153 start_codon:yes stop_codon:yes gene_type:complete